MAETTASSLDELQAKAEQKKDYVQQIIRQLERAMSSSSEDDRRWLESLLHPNDPSFRTIVKLVISPKYQGFWPLTCVCLRALWMILKMAQMKFDLRDPDLGWKVLVELAGDDLAFEVRRDVCKLVEGPELRVACLALMVMAELGPCVLKADRVWRIMDLLQAVPDRADDLSEVALRVHAWGSESRLELCLAAVQHPGGRLLVEVLLQVINRCDEKRRCRAVKVLSGCLSRPEGSDFLYTNDARVLVEILLRELPNNVENVKAFECHAECFKALTTNCAAARAHRREEQLQLMADLRDDERCEHEVRTKSAEILAVLAQAGA
eukprot:TRINITY_DN30041_c0_g1_i2.p1 TRINITY_DN30041_c0_g1~~TRINITY_DN30041_c0_g1_i2.p1  ORF type:complete len:322 (-),score=59.75 TRINITY_DN30041_c0_g1_i2:267-1232(-)